MKEERNIKKIKKVKKRLDNSKKMLILSLRKGKGMNKLTSL